MVDIRIVIIGMAIWGLVWLGEGIGALVDLGLHEAKKAEVKIAHVVKDAGRKVLHVVTFGKKGEAQHDSQGSN